MWSISKLRDNLFRITKNDLYIEFKVMYDKLVNLCSRDISEDNVLFIPHAYVTPNDDEILIGDVFEYDGRTCTTNNIVEVKVTEANVQNPKLYIENFFAA